ncbi:mucin-2-like [Zootermopsis nevadensis]|uniref:Uncharacterized protein n=1 Tax=Zootermopsis nevadensis TaxID=136037 RepID=A0A067QNR2_ZOONE|nr:mucin-2-like [Zootermopsis nevadensis]KDR11176.1 hypothetical protein L798_14684 [Zootermopsis nevadensis]
MDLQPRFIQMLQLLVAVALCVPSTTAQHLIAFFVVQQPPAVVTLNSVPVSATHIKLGPHPLSTGGAVVAPGTLSTAALIGPVNVESIVPAPTDIQNLPHLGAHQIDPDASTTGVPIPIPLKLFFTRFPPFIETIVQKIQNYFSTYNHAESENNLASPPYNTPLQTTTTTTPAPMSATMIELPSTTITSPLPPNTGSEPGNRDQTDDDTSPPPSFTEPEDNKW